MSTDLQSNPAHEPKEILLGLKEDILIESSQNCNNLSNTLTSSVEGQFILSEQIPSLERQIIFSETPSQGEQNILSEETGTHVEEASLGSIKTSDTFKTEFQVVKAAPVQLRGAQEVSPFKQVKGFVLDKLSKKVGSSNILSGIREKIIKKKIGDDDEVISVLSSDKHEISFPNPIVKAPSSEALYPANVTELRPNSELRSVVANDLAETDIVEDADECFEHLKPSSNDLSFDTDGSISLRTSISLPVTPIHQNIKTSRRNSYMTDEQNFEKKDPVAITFLYSDLKKHNDDNSYSDFELKSDVDNELISENSETCDSLNESHNDDISAAVYPDNVYRTVSENSRDLQSNKLFVTMSDQNTYTSYATRIFTFLGFSNVLILLTLLIHNASFLSPCVTLVFDSFVVAYVFYSYTCNVASVESNNVCQQTYFTNSDVNILDKENREIHQGCVKFLKGAYDPDGPPRIDAVYVDVLIQDNFLKMSPGRKKQATDGSSEISLNTSYNLSGAKISLIPKTLPRKKIWRKKFPIRIVLRKQLSLSATDESNVLSEEEQDMTDGKEALSQDTVDKALIKSLYIFSLTDREKESWYWALTNACKIENDQESSPTSISERLSADRVFLSSKDQDPKFKDYINDLLNSLDMTNVFKSVEDIFSYQISNMQHNFEVKWLNLTLGRMFYDFLTQEQWAEDVKRRIQKKLDKIDKPKFIEGLTLTGINLGDCLPKIKSISNPVINALGLWMDIVMEYDGTFNMTLETKIKISDDRGAAIAEIQEVMKDEYESNVSSEEEADFEAAGPSKNSSPKHHKPLFNMMEKWVNTKRFQNLAQNKYVKKYVCDLSNMPLILTVEVNKLHGTLALNIPPVPTDRLWYGFRKNPQLSLKIYPKVGTREINIAPVIMIIKKNLVQEFQKALVLPNMEDLLIPIMHTTVYDS